MSFSRNIVEVLLEGSMVLDIEKAKSYKDKRAIRLVTFV